MDDPHVYCLSPIHSTRSSVTYIPAVSDRPHFGGPCFFILAPSLVNPTLKWYLVFQTRKRPCRIKQCRTLFGRTMTAVRAHLGGSDTLELLSPVFPYICTHTCAHGLVCSFSGCLFVLLKRLHWNLYTIFVVSVPNLSLSQFPTN